MKSRVIQSLPISVRRSLHKFGLDLAAARKRRKLTVAMMTERLGVAKSTYLRIEKGDPSVHFGAYAMALFVLGLGTPMAELADARGDDDGLVLDAERLPKRVRVKRDGEAR